MALPIAANTTCDIYRNANAPPAPPDVPGVKGFLKASNRHSINTNYHTHLLLVDANTDVRDGYTGGVPQGNYAPGCDFVYIPDKNSKVQYAVAEVRRVGRGGPLDHKRVYLLRLNVTYPTNDL
jgi:hypothetical protein